MNRYKLCIKGKNPDYFLNKVIERNINIYDIEKKYNELYLVVDVLGYKNIKKIRTSYEIKVIEVLGLLKVKEMFSKYFLFLFFFCLGICLNVVLSKMIFEVEVVHSNGYIRELVYNELARVGIEKFKFKVNFKDNEKIVSEILDNNRDYIEWIEIEEVGTKYIVNVEQRKKNEENKKCVNRNIVASKNAMILEIVAEEGEVVKKKLDYVVQGDVIISGVIHNKEKVVAQKCAVGKVYGEVWYKVLVELPTHYHEENITGNSKVRLEFKFLNNKYVFLNDYNTYTKNSIITLKNELLPIGLSLVKYLETDVVDYLYTLDNCEEVALTMAEERLKNRLAEDDIILTKKVLKKEIKESKIIVEVFLKVKENITSYQDIDLENSEDGG